MAYDPNGLGYGRRYTGSELDNPSLSEIGRALVGPVGRKMGAALVFMSVAAAGVSEVPAMRSYLSFKDKIATREVREALIAVVLHSAGYRP